MSWNLEWLNQNSVRGYPFKEDASRTDLTAALTIPNAVVVDFIMVVPDLEASTYYLRSLMYSGSTLTFEIAQSGDVVASVTVTTSAHTTNTAYTVRGQGSYYGAVGKLVVGDLTGLADLIPPGVYVFDAAATVFEARCVRPDIRALNSLVVVDADLNESPPITGRVRLIAGNNIRLTYVAATEDAISRIRIDAINNPDYDEECDCEDTTVAKIPITTINGEASLLGEFDIESGSPCLSITTESGRIVLTDTCSKPCCGCSEQELITERMALYDATLTKLESMLQQVAGRQQDFFDNVIATLT